MNTLEIYTDGACSGNPGPGGWGVVMLYNGSKKELSGYEQATTNNRMEMQAAIEGLRAIKASCPVLLYSDSSYLVNAVNKGWLENWQKNGWKTADKKEVKNQDLWQELVSLNKQYNPKYIWVKGHAENEHNNRADELAVSAIKNSKQ
ncbi:MAG: ribonuclease HI [Firmicutes bacterium]|nr:ribonuclease HI [Bacillota bacterium]